MNPYQIVEEFERKVADFTGARFGIAVNSCTNAILLCLSYLHNVIGFNFPVSLPKRTYVGVAYSVINAGLKCVFRDEDWKGAYRLGDYNITDSARRFHFQMFDGGFHCVSFHWTKHHPIGRGGMILTNDQEAAEVLKIMRFDGRRAGVAPAKDSFMFPGYHCYMIPEDAARGLMLPLKSQPDLPNDEYPDLSKFDIFKEGMK